jgi:hypothetical protein
MEPYYKLGVEFVARTSYPFLRRGEATKSEDFSYDIRTGERIKIDSYKDGRYKLINLSLGIEQAWVEVTEEELIKIKRIRTNYGL